MRRMMSILLLLATMPTVSRAQTSREVTVTHRTVAPVSTKLRFTTVIVLPEGEQILDFVCGDKDFWVVSGAENLAYVKPAKAGAQTNLNLVTASGRVYSFLLTEGGGEPDLKLYVSSDSEGAAARPSGPRFYAAAQVEEIHRQADAARADALAAKADAAKTLEEGMNAFRASYPSSLQFPYRFKANESPFHVSAIYHDGRFTYIRANTNELPSLYEIRDGTPNLVNFQVEHGTYIVPKVLERGYLTVGAKRLVFETR